MPPATTRASGPRSARVRRHSSTLVGNTMSNLRTRSSFCGRCMPPTMYQTACGRRRAASPDGIEPVQCTPARRGETSGERRPVGRRPSAALSSRRAEPLHADQPRHGVADPRDRLHVRLGARRHRQASPGGPARLAPRAGRATRRRRGPDGARLPRHGRPGRPRHHPPDGQAAPAGPERDRHDDRPGRDHVPARRRRAGRRAAPAQGRLRALHPPRAAGRRARHRRVELPAPHRRQRDRAGAPRRQRRADQARPAHAALRRPLRGRVRAHRGAGRARRRGDARSRRDRGADPLRRAWTTSRSPARSRAAARSTRRSRTASSTRASSSAARIPPTSARTPTSSSRWRTSSTARSTTPARAAAASSASTSPGRSTTASSTPRSPWSGSTGWATRRTRPPRWGRSRSGRARPSSSSTWRRPGPPARAS